MYVCMNICMYVFCMYVCMYVFCMYVCMYVCMYLYMYVDVCMSVCVYTLAWFSLHGQYGNLVPLQLGSEYSSLSL